VKLKHYEFLEEDCFEVWQLAEGFSYRSIEYLKLEGIHKDHQVQLPASCGTTIYEKFNILLVLSSSKLFPFSAVVY